MIAKLTNLFNGFLGGELNIPLPHLAAVLLGALLTAAQAVNQAVLNLPPKWHAYLGVGLAVLGYLAVKPLVGSQFRDELPLPSWVYQVITGLVAAGTVIVGARILPAGSLALVILSSATTALIALGFGPGASALAAKAQELRQARRQARARQICARSGHGARAKGGEKASA